MGEFLEFGIEGEDHVVAGLRASRGAVDQVIQGLRFSHYGGEVRVVADLYARRPVAGAPVADHVRERLAQGVDAVVDGALRGGALDALRQHGLAVSGQDQTPRRGDASLGLEPVLGVVGQRLPGVDLPVYEHHYEPDEPCHEQVEGTPEVGIHGAPHGSSLYASPSASRRPALSETSRRRPVSMKLPTTEEPP